MRLKHEILDYKVGLGGSEEGILFGVLVFCLNSYSKFCNFE